MLLQGLEAVGNNDKSTKPLVTHKRRQAITNGERKTVRDYYFDFVNRKLTYKYVQEWFLQEF